ncbi:MAG: hypothetical protein A4E35_01600 [Methanoregula sp. PtaU1.Bin051]|nr:MAG: hypothetical protein A4E35_01600 [Methanoregula sp. PtaU1.Bin051]
MKRITVILIIAICLSILAMPVTAAGNEIGRPAGIALPSNDNQGQGDAVRKVVDRIEENVTQVRETIQEQLRNRNQTGKEVEPPVQNQTRERQEIQTALRANETDAVRNTSVIRERILQERNVLNATLRNATPVRAGWVANDNEVRLAVHTLLAMEDITGGIGPQVSEIARDFNNSALQTWQLEEQIRSRDAFSRFFFGGDRVSAAELTHLTTENQNRIRQIEQLMNTAGLDTETRAMLEEQLRIMQEENARLGQVASAEQQSRGLFGLFG